MDQSWFFAAVKLLRTSPGAVPTTPHPLAFKFRTDSPVYPLRLTGTQKNSCGIDLYVFGPGRAVADNPDFQMVQCGATERRPASADPLRWRKENPDNIALIHPQLCSLVPGTPTATKLSGTLTPDSMARDARISWGPRETIRERLYTPEGLRRIVVNYAVAVSCTVGLLMVVLVKFKKVSLLRGVLACCVMMVIVSSAGYAAYSLTPVTALRPPDKAAHSNALIHNSLLPRRVATAEFSTPRTLARDPVRFREALERIRQEADDRWSSLYARNNFTGRPRIEEDSPGNYVIRSGPHGVEYLWYDQDGGEHVVQLAELIHLETDAQARSALETTPAPAILAGTAPAE